jgi:hypothetical protein
LRHSGRGVWQSKQGMASFLNKTDHHIVILRDIADVYLTRLQKFLGWVEDIGSAWNRIFPGSVFVKTGDR